MARRFLRLFIPLAAMAAGGCDGGSQDPPGDPPAEDMAVETDEDVQPDICEAERRRCTDDGVEVCADGRAWQVLGPCPGGTVCEGGECVEPACEPDCQGRICGSDGCGGECGGCAPGETCSLEGRCDPPAPRCGDDACNGDEDCATCPADCGNCCGDGTCAADGGESCTTCPADCGCAPGEVCDAGSATCQACAPQCAGRACGDDGCGGQCGACDDGVECVAGQCDDPCVPACADRACGGDGCGGSCGDCAGDDVCTAEGACVDPPARCGDSVCDADEDCSTCPADCGNCCGDGQCAPGVGEDCSTCPADCGCPDGEACDVEDRRCEPVCVPQCAGRNCGDDGCGGLCGECLPAQECAEGVCRDVCQPMCEGRVCGGDGCQGSCGMCEAGEQCTDGACEAICSPNCEGRMCGPDGCGGFCGNCGVGAFCTEDGLCEAVCVPDCDGRECGDNGCGGDCGGCGPDEECDVDGICVERCVPVCAGRACGDDGCGGVCGVCPDGAACAPGGVCVGGDGCDCVGDDVCLDGVCRSPDELCGEANPVGLCPGGRSCLVGVCDDRGAACGENNPTGVCPVGEACRNGVCEALDAAALCDDGNACTDDLYDPVRNACVNVPVDALCSDGNACTVDACVDGVCVGEGIPGCIEPPTVEPVQSPTNEGDLTLRGTKPAGASVQINGAEAAPESPDEDWSIELQLQPGENVFEIGTRDMGVDSETVTVTVVYDITPPTITVTPDGGVFTDGITLTVSTDEPATVYYTDDGGTPDNWSKRFRSIKRIRVFHDVRFRFRARDEAGNWSEGIVESSFEITTEGTGWRAEAPLPEALIHPAVVVTTEGIHVIGGSDGNEPQAGAWRYDSEGAAWVESPALPTARAQAAATSVSTAVYLVGGQDDGIPLNGLLRLDGAGAEQWEVLSPMPTTRFGLSLSRAQDPNHLYAFGGKTNGGVVLDTAERYDWRTDTWNNDIPAMPRPRYGHSTVFYEDLLFVIGGEDEDGVPIAEVDVFDTRALEWSAGPALPTPRSFAAAGRIYNEGRVTGGSHEIVVAGGRLGDGSGTAVVESLVLPDGIWRTRRPLDVPRHSAGSAAVNVPDPLDMVERRVLAIGGLVGGGGPVGAGATAGVVSFGHEKDYLRTRPALPDGRFAHAAVEINGLFYLLGGRNFQPTDVFWAYDPETGRSVELPPLPSLQNGVAAVELDGLVYAIGGANQFNNAVPTLRRYDPAARRWTELRPMITARTDAAAVVLDDEIWVIGGDNNGAQQTVEIYDPAADRWRAGPVLPEGRRAARAVVHDGEILVVGGVGPDDAVFADLLALVGGAWQRRYSAPHAWHQMALIGDHQLTIFNGRGPGGLVRQPSSVDLNSRIATRQMLSSSNLFDARDRAAAVAHHGRVYILGGNQSVNVGPEGAAGVQAVMGQCFNGVLDGREEAADLVPFDAGGGCPLPLPPRQGEARLQNGNRLGVRAIVEVYWDGTWRYVCDDNWDNVDASVACRQIFGPGVTGVAACCGQGPAAVFVFDDVQCNGAESSLAECRYTGPFNDNCGSNETARMTCRLE